MSTDDSVSQFDPAPYQSRDLERECEDFRKDFKRVREALGSVLLGQDEVVEEVLVCLLAGGHALIEGLPGLGKTLLAESLGHVLGLTVTRIQFTPDLMPADITGTTVLEIGELGGRSFRFEKGPIFSQVVLGDEINRATPKTQSALLEAMQERHVTIGGRTHPLPTPFLVLATQNPIELEGTYPLPEAQVDRFFFKIKIGMPSKEWTPRILDETTRVPRRPPESVLDAERVGQMSRLARETVLSSEVLNGVTRLLHATDPQSPEAAPTSRRYLRYGLSIRAGQCLVLSGKIHALLAGRYHVNWEDVTRTALPVLRHRIGLGLEADLEGLSPEALIEKILREVSL
jgi:MoxR-like ATPase